MNSVGALSERVCRIGRAHDTAYLIGPRTYTHADVHGLAARLTMVLADRGVRPGERVLLALPDGVELVALFLAIGRLGAVAIVVNPELPAGDHAALTERTAPVLSISSDELESRFGSSWAEASWLCRAAQSASEGPVEPMPDDAPLYVQFTSGTTGVPKGAVHRHRDMLAYHVAVGEKMLGIGPDDVSLSISKIFFAYGFGNSVVYPLYSGSAAVLAPHRPKPEEIAELIDRHHVTVLHGVPSAYANLVAETTPEAYRSVRAAVSAGESMPVPLGRRTEALLGVPVLDELGSTEVGGAYCANTTTDNHPGTIGRPLEGYRLEVRDDDGRPVPPGVEGRLCVSGATIMAGYLDDPHGTSEVLTGGWLSTNDTGICRPDGRFEYTGRTDDIEVVGGINISPREVESVLLEHSAVRDVVVAAVPDERDATKLRAYVVTDAAPDALAHLEGELLAMARGRLAAFKVPRSVTFVPDLPRTFTGKKRRFVARTGTW